MSLAIQDAEFEALARELAAATGESVTRAVTIAARERLDRVRDRGDVVAAEGAARLRAIARDAAGRWVEPHRSADHADLLHDEAGLPR
ncbi:type II toxin-antitoxin system VapB family antitoxin [Geodermatophilus marinus]|uniref:type II toxin-antitoxin system VapB family antitoxin n=1 Tax=Geodermatophilus sp. LHW52908 TaxID=2303986 RepID=UPI0013149FB7|nr:type II toxin-antitoxin system VapB family antitoxin [Geodermatophilus sp. LHW52908]